MINAYALKEGMKIIAVVFTEPEECTVTYVTANGKHIQVKTSQGERMISPANVVEILP